MMNIRDQVRVQAITNIEKAQERQKKSQDAKQQPLRFKEGDIVLLRNLWNEARKGGKLERAWSGPYTISKALPKGLYNLRNEDGTELKTSFDSSRLKIYYHSVQSHPNTNTQVEMPLKSSADKEDKNTSTKLTKSVKVYVLEKDRNTILSNGRLDDNFINESQNILKKQFPNIGGWKDTLLCQTSFSAVSEESVQITKLGKQLVFSTSINEHLRVYDSSPSEEWLDLSCEVLKTAPEGEWLCTVC